MPSTPAFGSKFKHPALNSANAQANPVFNGFGKPPGQKNHGGYGTPPGMFGGAGKGPPQMGFRQAWQGLKGAPQGGKHGWTISGFTTDVSNSPVTGPKAPASQWAKYDFGNQGGYGLGDQISGAGMADFQNTKELNEFNYGQNMAAAEAAFGASQQASADLKAAGEAHAKPLDDMAGQISSQGQGQYDDMRAYVEAMNQKVGGENEKAYGEFEKAIGDYKDLSAQNISGQAHSMARGLADQMNQIANDPSLPPEVRAQRMAEAKAGFESVRHQALVPLANQFNDTMAQMRQSLGQARLAGTGTLAQTMGTGGQLLADAGRTRTANAQISAGLAEAAAGLRNANALAAAQYATMGAQQLFENVLRNPFMGVNLLDTLLTMAGANRFFDGAQPFDMKQMAQKGML